MRQINKKHFSIFSINSDVHDKSWRFVCGFCGAGISFICSLILVNFGININFPLEMHIFHGFTKNLYYKSMKWKNGHKLEIQCYFKDNLNTGVSLCHNVPDFDLDMRSYISISILGFTVYIADSYCLSIQH